MFGQQACTLLLYNLQGASTAGELMGEPPVGRTESLCWNKHAASRLLRQQHYVELQGISKSELGVKWSILLKFFFEESMNEALFSI